MLRNSCHALHLFIAGMLVLPSLLFQPRLEFRVLQVILFAILALLAGKRIRWLYFLLLIASITLFNLFSPIGRILLQVGPLNITAGALRLGLQKSITIVGLVFLSLFSIRSDLHLPGSVGGLLARLFFYFERIMEQRRRISRRRIIASIDAILESIFSAEKGHEDSVATGSSRLRTTPFGWLCLTLLVVSNWGLLALSVVAR